MALLDGGHGQCEVLRKGTNGRRWSDEPQRCGKAVGKHMAGRLAAARHRSHRGADAADALMSTEPFREPYRGRDGVRSYVSKAFNEEEDPQAQFGTPIVDGDRAAVSWWASLREEGTDTTLAGTSVLRFNAEGLVVEQWDAWNVIRERREPPRQWSPFAGE